MNGPNPISVGWSALKALRAERPDPAGTAPEPDHQALGGVLGSLGSDGVAALPDHRTALAAYVDGLSAVQPDALDAAGALAYWLNLYNAGALLVAADAYSTALASVLRVPGGFTKPFVSVADERLSLSDVEHGKIRRFKDPRIHSALVCGSVSCPTLRYEPYQGSRLDAQLDAQTRFFLSSGGAAPEGDTLRLSRVFLWYGSDFVRPSRMPTFFPSTRRQVVAALRPWLAEGVERSKVAFQPYDWSLACSVNRPD